LYGNGGKNARRSGEMDYDVYRNNRREGERGQLNMFKNGTARSTDGKT